MRERAREASIFLMAGVVSLACLSCVTTRTVVRSDSLQFLYPEGSEVVQAGDVNLKLPLRVGLAFVPAGTRPGLSESHPISAAQRQELLDKIAAAFRDKEFIAALDVIPSTYLTPGGGFEDLDRLRSAFGIDLIVLVSYEQTQFTATTGRSIAYWTLVGAYFVRGEKNETQTMLEAVVYDVPSRALLFRASGSSSSESRFTPVGEGRKLHSVAEEGFRVAAADLIKNLESALTQFQEQIKDGTVRGIGTPALRVTDASGTPVSGRSGGGAGAWGWTEIALLALLVPLDRLGRRRLRGRC
ncbi:MAG: rhombotarget lipoprotein [Acidobacteriota bacterium]